MLADVFENFQNICLETHELDPAYCLTTPELAWKAGSKKNKVRLDLLTDIDILLMGEKGVRGGISRKIIMSSILIGK